MARKESNIYKRKDGRWEARYVKEIGLDGRKKYGSVYGGTYTEAQQKRLEIMRNVRPYVVSSNSSVLSDIMWEWIQSVRNSIKPNTLQKYDSIIRKHIETTVIGKTNKGTLMKNPQEYCLFLENRLESESKLAGEGVQRRIRFVFPAGGGHRFGVDPVQSPPCLRIPVPVQGDCVLVHAAVNR